MCCGSMRNPASEHPNGGVPIRRMFDRGRMGSGGVSVSCARLLIETHAPGHPDSGVVVAIGISTLHYMVVASASIK